MFNENTTTRQSIKSLAKQIKQHPMLFARLGECHIELNDWNRAEKILGAGTDDFPDYITGYLVLGEGYLYQDQIRDAEEAALNGLRHDPNHLGLMHLLEKVKRRREDFVAVDKIQRCIRMRDPLFDEALAKRDQEDPETVLVWSEYLTELMVRADERVAPPLAQREKRLDSSIEEDIEPVNESNSIDEESVSDLERPPDEETIEEETSQEEVPDLESRLLSAKTDEEMTEEADALADDIIRRVEEAQDAERKMKGHPPSDIEEPLDEGVDPLAVDDAAEESAPTASEEEELELPPLKEFPEDLKTNGEIESEIPSETNEIPEPSTEEIPDQAEELEAMKLDAAQDESESEPPEEEPFSDIEEPLELAEEESEIPPEDTAEDLEIPETSAAATDLEPPVAAIQDAKLVDEIEAEDIALSSVDEEISEVTETDEAIISETQELLAEFKKTESEDMPEDTEEPDFTEEEVTIRPAKIDNLALEEEARQEAEASKEESAEKEALDESEEVAAKPQKKATFKFLEDIDAFGLPMNMEDKELLQDLGLESEEQSKDRKEPEPQANTEGKPASPPPKNRIATRTLGELYATQQKYDEAIDVYQQLIEKDPENQSYKERLEDLKKRKALSSI
ncbi:tetratricopeptide repeat protein [bacterium]|nr:tetratricopeptide repeat protein [bacterium]